jgi:SAM-dependent methyltransferase
VDFGCGTHKQPGAIGVDIARVAGVDVIADITRPLPFRDSSVDAVYGSHLVEHLDDVMAFMGEVHRICRPDALVYFRFPNATSPYMLWKDPTHRRGVLLDTFDYFDPSTSDGKVFGYYQPARFRIVKQRITFNLQSELVSPGRARRLAGVLLDALANRNERAQYFCERFWGPFAGMEEAHIWMRAIK